MSLLSDSIPVDTPLGIFLLVVTIVGLLAAVVAVPAISRRLDRARIAHRVERRGGTLIQIARMPNPIEWFMSRGSLRRYEVTYRTGDGGTTTASCVTSLFTDVYWVDDAASALPRRRA